MKELLHSLVVTALCWTLLHSLWQGLLAAVIAATLRLSTKKASPTFRYNSLFLLLSSLFAASVLTFLYEWSSMPANTGSSALHAGAGLGVRHGFPFQLFSAYIQEWNISAWIQANADSIVTVWLAMLLFKTVRMGFTLGYTGYIRRHKSAEPSAYWKAKLIVWCKQLDITRVVTLLEGGILRLPVIFGHFRPVIFVPLGLLTRLPAEQVEAILLHELAHIRRNDYAVNLMQCLIEALYFFNPAILWLSSLIREEREHCCDDMAIEQTRNRKLYVETLISFRESTLYRYEHRETAFPGFKGSLSGRVRRIVTRQNETLTLAEKSSLACCCLIAALLLVAAAGPQQTQITIKLPPSGDREMVAANFPIGKIVDDISDGLLDAGVIRDKNKLAFELTNTQLLVIGHKQPEALWKTFKIKYLETSPYPIRPEHRRDADFGIFFNAVTHVYGIGTRPPAWGHLKSS